MFNVTVVNIKDILKYLAGLTLTIVIIVGLARYFYADKEDINEKIKISSIAQKSYIECMDKTIPEVIDQTYEETDNDEDSEKMLEKLLKVELSMLGVTNVKTQDTITVAENMNNQELTLADTNLDTEVVTKNPLENKYTTEYGKVKIKNETSFQAKNIHIKLQVHLERLI